MDDICDSVDTEEEAEALTADIDEVLKKGGFTIKEWTMNKVKQGMQEPPRQVLLGSSSYSENVLGVIWYPEEDTLTSKTKTPPMTPDDTPTPNLTKRQVLSKLATLFDPIGAFTAVLVKAKIAMQELWQLGLNWDQELPPEVREKWLQLFSELNKIKEVRFERCLKPLNVVTSNNPELLVFCGASRSAFGA